VGKFWGHHEYAPQSNSWNTWLGEFSVLQCETPADNNGDCVLNLDDWTSFADCLTGPDGVVTDFCACFDLDQNGLVDMADVGSFLDQYTGDGAQIPGCEY
jgi:hypothetical protein